ncbi:hypothetical protein FHT91_006063 [Rhizobium sp. BK347]|nr:hypothetical protein [Rhizobium sp. BK252]MBB3405819.1 hypothetical protein [Rhizobium sp. BK289]MBB3418367.1 hypothetical protein [Rhizobium sp. BK284]MBB3486245.1 hypothetical protein [Rhizobium sp. BK347]
MAGNYRQNYDFQLPAARNLARTSSTPSCQRGSAISKRSISFRQSSRELAGRLAGVGIQLSISALAHRETCDANYSGYVFDAGNHMIPATDMKPGLPKDLAFEAAVLLGVNEIRPAAFPAT